jgi:Sulfotransferase family
MANPLLTDRLIALARWARHRAARGEAGLRRVERRFAPAPADRVTATLADGYASGWARARCLFVLSSGRTGTQTLAAILDASPHLLAHHEVHPRLVKASFDYHMAGGARAADRERWRELVLAARDDLVLNASRRGRIYAETSNRVTYIADLVRDAFPASQFVFLHRAPLEVIVSGQRRGWYQDHPWDFARIVPRSDDPEAERWPSMTRVERIAWYWAAVNGEAADFLETLPAERRLELRADALFDPDSGSWRELFAFLGVPEPPERSIRGVLGRRLNRQVGGHAASPPAEWSENERATVMRLVGPVAERLGYPL